MKLQELLKRGGELARKKSLEGYYINKEEPFKFIKSPRITMKDVQPLIGTPRYAGGVIGNPVLMLPDKEYYFPGAFGVMETPVYKKGGKNKAYKGSGTKDDCYYKAVEKYGPKTSAYRSGYMSKCRKAKQNKKSQGGMVSINNVLNLYKKGGTFDKEKKEGLHGWFGRNKGTGWVDCKTGKPCGRQKGEKRKSYPACRPTKADCNDYKQPKGKTSSKRYDWKKKALGGLLEPPKGKNIYKLIDKMVELTDNKYTRDDFLNLLDKVSLVESGDKNIPQIGGGPAFGHYQIEDRSFEVNNRRLKNFMEETGLELEYRFPKSARDATKEEQAMNALIGIWKSSRAKGEYMDPTNVEETWLRNHWAGPKELEEKRRKHFRRIIGTDKKSVSEDKK